MTVEPGLLTGPVRVELGNEAPKTKAGRSQASPCVTYAEIPQTYLDTTEPGLDVAEAKAHISGTLYRESDRYGITRLSDLGHGE